MTGFKKPVDMRTVFFKPVNASTGEKIQNRDIQFKFTCGVLKKKPRGFGQVSGRVLKTHRYTPWVFFR